jgi:hypothetical protein
MWNNHMFIITCWHNFHIWVCDALVKGLIFCYGGEGFKSLYATPTQGKGVSLF